MTCHDRLGTAKTLTGDDSGRIKNWAELIPKEIYDEWPALAYLSSQNF